MARFSAVVPLDLSLHKRSLNTIFSLCFVTTGTGIDPPQRSHFARPRLGQFLQAALAVILFCSAPLRLAAQTLSPTSVAFGNWPVQTTSTVLTVKLTNTLTTPLTISSISVSGDFAQTSKCPIAPNTLNAGATCQISVTFTPTVLGARTGTLTVNDNGTTSFQTASLSGMGVSPVVLSSASLNFGNQVISTTSTVKTITLTNYQSVALSISAISTSVDFAQTSTCPLSPNTLASRASCTISVTFTPSTLGNETGTLTVTDNANTSPQTVALSGTGSLTGLSSIAVTPANSSILIGGQQQFTATGGWQSGLSVNITPFVTWSSSAPAVASISSTGLVQGTTQGNATIMAIYGAVIGFTTVTVGPPSLTSITVIPANPSVPVGAYEQFTATLSYSDGSTKETTSSVSWSSATPSVATISNSGLATALAAGSTTITATLGSVTGSTTLSVSRNV
jgi:hypothetical protein